MLIQGTAPDTIGLGQDAGSDFAAALAGLCGPLSLPLGCPGHRDPGEQLLPRRQHDPVRRQELDLDGGRDRIGEHRQGGGRGGAGDQRRQGRLARGGAAPRRDAGDPRADGGAGDDRQHRRDRSRRPGGQPDRAPEDQWTPHFGWGRVDLGAAVSLARSGKIPPEASINSPDWYAPLTGDSFRLTGLARARFASGGQFHWKLQWGAGEAPASWNTAAEGDSNRVVGNFGTIDLAQVRTALASYTPPPDLGGPTFSANSPNPFRNEFTVRLTVTGAGIPTPGIDRRVFTALPDQGLRAGFPKRMGTGGEAPIRYADINGDNVQELIVPTEDGAIHAYEPNGSELPGWPVHTRLEKSAVGHANAPGFRGLASTPAYEPPRGALVADLDGDGRQEVIDTAGTHIYVWEPDGTLRPGFPVESNLGFCGAAHESQPLVHPKCGFLSSPAVGRLKGRRFPLDIVAPSLDGHLYAYDGAGHLLPGFPVQLVDPNVPADQRMIAESINEPAIGDLNGDGRDDVVVATNETYGAAPPSPGDIPGGFGQGLSAILANAAGGSSRVYAVNGANGQFMSGWPIELNGAIQDTLPLIGPGQNPALVEVGGAQRVVVSTTGSATIGIYKPDGTLDRAVQQGAYGPSSDATDRSGTINLFESASVGKLLPAGGPDIVKYGLSLSDVANLALVGQNVPYNHLIGAYDPATGLPLPAFPRVTDDFQFLSSSDVAKVDPASAGNQVLAGTGLGLLHAYDGVSGLDAPGFPKVTGGWLFAPAALSNDGRIADITREGYLFQWNVPNLPACQTEWPSFRHDQQGSGNYDRDGTPPSKVTGLSLAGNLLTFTAPGDDAGCGTAARYQIATSDSPLTPQNFVQAQPLLPNPPQPLAAGSVQTYTLPAHKRYISIRAIDDASLSGFPAPLDTQQP